MGDFALPSFDFGGVSGDLDFSLSDVRRGGNSDGIETCRYDRPSVYDNTLGEVEYEHACDFVDGMELRDGYRAFAFVSGNFVFGDVLEAMVDQHKDKKKTGDLADDMGWDFPF